MKLLHIPTASMCFMDNKYTIIHILENFEYTQKIFSIYKNKQGNWDRDFHTVFTDRVTEEKWEQIKRNKKDMRTKLNYSEIDFDPVEFELVE